MPIYSWKWLYPLIGLALGYAVWLQIDGSDDVPWSLLVLPAGLFAALWIRDKERILLAIVFAGISLNIDRAYHLEEDFLLSRWGYLISTTSIALAGLYSLLFVKLFLYKESLSNLLSFSKFHILVLFYLMALILSCLNSNDMYISSFEVFYQVQCIFLYFYLVYYIDDESKFNFAIQMLIAGLFFQVVIVFIQYMTGTQFDIMMSGKSHTMNRFTYHGNVEFLRPGGTFHAYNTLADYLTTLLFITLGYLFSQKSPMARFLVGACLGLGIAALILTHSRGAWFGFALGAGIFFVISLRRHWVTLKAGIVMLTAGMLVLLPFLPRIYLRLTESDEGSGLGRIPLAKLAWNIIQEHPFLGVGTNNFGLVIQEYVTSDIRGEWLHLVHNKYLLIFAEMGLLGITSFLLLMLGMMWLCYRCVKADHPLFSPLALGLIASLVCDAFHMLVDIFQARVTVEMFWIMAALAVIACRFRQHGAAPPIWAPHVAAQPRTGLASDPAGVRW